MTSVLGAVIFDIVSRDTMAVASLQIQLYEVVNSYNRIIVLVSSYA